MEEKKLSLVEEKDKEVTQEEKKVLYNRVEELKRSNATLLEENEILDKFVVFWGPEYLFRKDRFGSAGTGGAPLEGGGLAWKRKSRFQASDETQLLTMDQKNYLAEKVKAQTQHELDDLHARSARTIDNYMASMEEADLRRADTKKSENDFDRRVKKIINDINVVMHQPDKVVRCVEDKFKVFLIKKLILQNQRLTVQKNKLQKDLKRLKEADKNPIMLYREYHPPKLFYTVDELKSMSMKIKRNLVIHREQLHNMSVKSTQLDTEITKMKQMLDKIDKEIQYTEEENVKEETLNRHLRQQLADYQAPDVVEYMHAKAKHKNLQQSIQSWERKVGIAEMALRTQTRGWNKQTSTMTPVNSVETGLRTGGLQVPVKLPDIAEHNI